MKLHTRLAAVGIAGGIALRIATGTAMVLALPGMAQVPSEFSWRGTLEWPAQPGAVRAALPAEALMRLRSPQAADVRVFDAKGQPVPFALTAAVDKPAPARQATAAFPALPLFSALAGTRLPPHGIQVRLDEGGQQRTVWVQMARASTGAAPAALAPGTTPGTATGAMPGSAPAGLVRLPTALFDVRQSGQVLSGLLLNARLPANAPIRFTLASSTDLAQWTPVPLRGRAYRFEGEGAPSNSVLELDAPLALEGRYLRLDWEGQDGVAVESVTGLVAPPARTAAQVRAAMPEPRRDGALALEWDTGSAMPLAALGLSATQANTLIPVRVLGRNQASEPWRQMAQGLVYRVGSGAAESSNPELVMPRTAARWLRVEATHGMRLDSTALLATAVFDAIELAFVAGGNGPYELAAGRADTRGASLPPGMIAAAAAVRLEDLPVARISATAITRPAPPSGFARLLPAGVDAKTAALWAVLLAAVAVLGAVAWSLFRQMGKAGAAAKP